MDFIVFLSLSCSLISTRLTAGYVGAGMLAAAVAGGVFASPPPASILAAILSLHNAGDEHLYMSQLMAQAAHSQSWLDNIECACPAHSNYLSKK